MGNKSNGLNTNISQMGHEISKQQKFKQEMRMF
jgi:hypothetical protein